MPCDPKQNLRVKKEKRSGRDWARCVYLSPFCIYLQQASWLQFGSRSTAVCWLRFKTAHRTAIMHRAVF